MQMLSSCLHMGHPMHPQADLTFKENAHLQMAQLKTMGILGSCEQEPFGEQVWKALLKKINDECGEHTKGAMLMLRGELIASCKAGHPC